MKTIISILISCLLPQFSFCQDSRPQLDRGVFHGHVKLVSGDFGCGRDKPNQDDGITIDLSAPNKLRESLKFERSTNSIALPGPMRVVRTATGNWSGEPERIMALRLISESDEPNGRKVVIDVSERSQKPPRTTMWIIVEDYLGTRGVCYLEGECVAPGDTLTKRSSELPAAGATGSRSP